MVNRLACWRIKFVDGVFHLLPRKCDLSKGARSQRGTRGELWQVSAGFSF